MQGTVWSSALAPCLVFREPPPGRQHEPDFTDKRTETENWRLWGDTAGRASLVTAPGHNPRMWPHNAMIEKGFTEHADQGKDGEQRDSLLWANACELQQEKGVSPPRRQWEALHSSFQTWRQERLREVYTSCFSLLHSSHIFLHHFNPSISNMALLTVHLHLSHQCWRLVCLVPHWIPSRRHGWGHNKLPVQIWAWVEQPSRYNAHAWAPSCSQLRYH